MKRILVTGASGFVGEHLLPALAGAGHDVATAGRRTASQRGSRQEQHTFVGDLGPDTDWTMALQGRDTVVHLAAEVPRRGLEAQRYLIANDMGTKRLVAQAEAAGVTRLVYLSSIFAATDKEIVGHVPNTPYGRSKRAAEAHVRDFGAAGRVGISLRPPLVYGAGATGNWAMLQKLAALPLPLPFAGVRNRRNVIAVENLVAAILQVINAPDTDKLSKAYAVADAGTVGLADMLTWMRAGMGRRPGLFPAPAGLLREAMKAAGQGLSAHSLFGDLWADTSAFRATFGWEPAVTSREAMMAAGRGVKARDAALNGSGEL